MRIHWQKFLAVGAISALGALGACQVEVVEGPASGGTGGTGGTGGAGGATGGAKGDAAPDAGTSGDAPSGDVTSTDGTSTDATVADVASDIVTADATADGARADGSTTDASPDVGDPSMMDVSRGDMGTTDAAIPDAAGACFAEDQGDGGATTRCADLPYYGVLCRDDGGLDWPPAGASLCDTLKPDLKATAMLELFACLKKLPGDDGGVTACSKTHDDGAADCSRAIFNRSMCPVPDGVVEGGMYGCSQIAASCGPDSGDGGIPVTLCQAWLGPFNAAARQGFIDCYLGPVPGSPTSCRDKFENYCVFP